MDQLKVVARACALGTVLVGALASQQAAAATEPNYGFIEGFIVKDQERIPDARLGLGGRIGLGIPAGDGIALEFGLFGNPINRKPAGNGEQEGLMMDLSKTFELGGIDPFIFGGVGGVRERLTSLDKDYFAAEIGAGVKMKLGDKLGLRTSLSAQDVGNNNYGKSSLVDYRFNVGLAMPFGAAAAAAPVAPRVVDSDGDGVPDAQDKCPGTPAMTADGCPPPAPVVTEPPKDSDGDGVADANDACPGTLAGLKVDSKGCPMESATIVLKGVNFVTGSAELTPAAKGVLDKAADSLKAQTGVNVEVGGHTDSLGDAKKNVALSQARADAVRKYLVGKGVDGARLTAKGYGSAQPIADNKTKAGRAENRRVELKVVK